MQEQARSARQHYSDAIFDVLMQGSRYVDEYHRVHSCTWHSPRQSTPALPVEYRPVCRHNKDYCQVLGTPQACTGCYIQSLCNVIQ